MRRWLVVFMVLGLLLPVIITACGGGGEEKTPTPTLTATATPSPTPTTPGLTPTATPTAMLTPTPTPTPTSTPYGPVKIGAIAPWSGPLAMTGMLADPIIKLVEKQVKDMGGILGGREVQVVKYDNRGSVAEAIAGATKLFKEDKVSALVFGGSSGADNIAVSDFAEANHIFYVDYSGVPNMAETKYTVSGTTDWLQYVPVYDFTNKVLKPKTVAILAMDVADGHEFAEGYRKGVEAAGAKVVYQEYTTQDVTDFTPYLTKIKYANPDVVNIYYGASEAYMSMAKQIVELGGWGNIKVITTAGAEPAVKLAGAQGWYVFVLWMPGLLYPGAVKFEQDFQAMYGRLPSTNQLYFYNPLWTAIYAIELAGTDTDLEKIAQVARSGKLEWETPMGRAHYAPDGTSGLQPSVTHVEGGKLVLVQVPE